MAQDFESWFQQNKPNGKNSLAAPVNVTTQDLAKGELNTDQKQVTFTPYRLANGQDTVAGQMQGLLASNSPYMKAATSAADQGMNAKGLLNSSMAISAGHKAAIESAMPIATQDAGYFQNQGLQKQQGDIQSGHIAQQGEIQRDLAHISGGYQLSAAHISGGYQLKATQLQGEIAMGLEDKRFANQSKLAGEERDWRDDVRSDEWDRDDTRRAEDLELDETRREEDRVLEGQKVWGQSLASYQSNIQKIVADPTLSPDQRRELIDLANVTMETTKIGHEAAYGVTLNWTPFILSPTPAPEPWTPPPAGSPDWDIPNA
jgi:hypothetical protein